MTEDLIPPETLEPLDDGDAAQTAVVYPPEIPPELIDAAAMENSAHAAGVKHLPAHNPIGFLHLVWKNPVVGKELRSSSRRKRYYLLRLAYLLALTGFVAVTWQSVVELTLGHGTAAYRISRMPLAGAAIVRDLSWFVFIAAQTIMLVLCSAAISSEQTGRTLPTLLSTPISCFQVVWGKLTGKLSHVLTLVLCTLPILGLIRIFGGVPWDFIICTSLLTLSASMMLGSLTAFYSASRKPWVAMIMAVVMFGLLHFSAFMASGLGYIVTGPFAGKFNAIFALATPWYGLMVCQKELSAPTGMGLTWWTLLNLPVAIAFAMWMTNLTSRKLRTIAYERGEIGIPVVPPGEQKAVDYLAWLSAKPPAAGDAVDTPVPARISVESAPPQDQTPIALLSAHVRSEQASPDYQQRKILKFSNIKGSPVYWLQMHTAARSNMLYLFAVLLPALFIVLIDAGLAMAGLLQYTRTHVPMVGVLLGSALAVSLLLATTSLAGERQARTLDVLLSTPMTPWQILRDKAAAALSCCRFLWFVLLGHVAFAVLLGQLHPVTLLHVTLLAVGTAVFVIGVGMLMSSIIHSPSLAVLVSLGMLAIIWVLVPALDYRVVIAVAQPQTAAAYRSSTTYQTIRLGNPFLQTASLIEGAPGQLSKDYHGTVLAQRPRQNLYKADPSDGPYEFVDVPNPNPPSLQYDLYDRQPTATHHWQEATAINATTSAAYAIMGVICLLLASRRVRNQE